MIQKGIKLYIIVEGWPKFQLILITATLSKIKINIWIIFSETDYCKTLLQFCLSRREREKFVSVWTTHKIMCEWIWSLEALLWSESTNFYGTSYYGHPKLLVVVLRPRPLWAQSYFLSSWGPFDVLFSKDENRMIVTWPLIAQEALFFKAINTTWPKKTDVTRN